MEKSWNDAIKRVLAESDTPLHYTEIAEQILSREYFKTDGATPAASVSSKISISIKRKQDKSPFVRVAPGIFTLRSKEKDLSTVGTKEEKNAEALEEESLKIIHSFGMYWQRELVIWRKDPKIFGKQPGAVPVDFGKQRGIYILYDQHTVVYVGRCTDRPLGTRLYDHTNDRLGGRWNRFSWFGLLEVTNDGNLHEVKLKPTIPVLIATLEGLLIEALEPPQNRKRGDDLSAIEYVQDTDPEQKEINLRKTLRDIEDKLRG